MKITNTKTTKREAKAHEEDGDALSLWSQVQDCCDLIDEQRAALEAILAAFDSIPDNVQIPDEINMPSQEWATVLRVLGRKPRS